MSNGFMLVLRVLSICAQTRSNTKGTLAFDVEVEGLGDRRADVPEKGPQERPSPVVINIYQTFPSPDSSNGIAFCEVMAQRTIDTAGTCPWPCYACYDGQ